TGSTLGVVGYGTTGRSVARLGQALDMRVLVAERKNADVVRDGRTSFEEVLRQSDIITLHCPLTEETRNLFGRAEFHMMKADALLINTARGGLIEDAALIQELQKGLIAGAGLDALREEPPRDGHHLLAFDVPYLTMPTQ